MRFSAESWHGDGRSALREPAPLSTVSGVGQQFRLDRCLGVKRFIVLLTRPLLESGQIHMRESVGSLYGVPGHTACNAHLSHACRDFTLPMCALT